MKVYLDLDICEVPIVSTVPVNKQLNNESESPIIEIENSKEIKTILLIFLIS
jgi:hypothetical protein